MNQTATTASGNHDHITNQGEKTITLLIDGSNPTAPFQLPSSGIHSHTLQLTRAQVDTLRAGGQITGQITGNVSSSPSGHPHTYTIFCG